MAKWGDLTEFGRSLPWPALSELGRSLPVPNRLRPPPATSEENLTRNAPYVRPGNHDYNTPLGMRDETEFRSWLQKNKVPFDAGAPVTDYDMRGFYKALKEGDPKAASAIDPNDKQIHYPDYWKTPYHETFSGESQWAMPAAPMWNSLDQLTTPGGRIRFDDRAEY